MSQSWAWGSYVFANLDMKEFQAAPGIGFYRLKVLIEVNTGVMPQGQMITLTDFHGELSVGPNTNQLQPLGRMDREGPKEPIMTFNFADQRSFYLEMELDARRIEAIERIRTGKELWFRLDVFGVAHGPETPPDRSLKAQFQQRVNQGTWIEMLEMMGYKRTLLLEVPVLDEKENPLLSEATQHLTQAQMHLNRGHYRDCVGSCRDVLEALQTALGDNEERLPELGKEVIESTKSWSKNQRIRAVRWALHVLAHPSRHADPVAIQMDWGPEDARAILTMTAALLQMAGK